MQAISHYWPKYSCLILDRCCYGHCRYKPMLNAVNEFEFYPGLERHQGELIVMFTHEKCGSCSHWKLLLEQLSKQRNTDIWLIDAVENMGLANGYEVFHLPSLFLFLDGHYHAPLQSEARLPELIATIEYLIIQPAQPEP